MKECETTENIEARLITETGLLGHALQYDQLRRNFRSAEMLLLDPHSSFNLGIQRPNENSTNQAPRDEGPVKKKFDLFSDEERKQRSYLGTMLRQGGDGERGRSSRGSYTQSWRAGERAEEARRGEYGFKEPTSVVMRK